MQLPFPEHSKLIVSVYDYTGKWAEPYIKAGYPVILWDKKYEGDILEGFTWLQIQIESTGAPLYGLLFAPPCTDFSVSGAWTWPMKDRPAHGFDPFTCTTELSEALVYICLHMIDVLKPAGFWALENPVGRIEKLVPELKPFRKMTFNPCDFGDPYTKKTILWGEFNSDLKKTPVAPIRVCKQGSWLQKLGGKGDKTKALRSITPSGFANAFFHANQ
jgi:hypothetical protein